MPHSRQHPIHLCVTIRPGINSSHSRWNKNNTDVTTYILCSNIYFQSPTRAHTLIIVFSVYVHRWLWLIDVSRSICGGKHLSVFEPRTSTPMKNYVPIYPIRLNRSVNYPTAYLTLIPSETTRLPLHPESTSYVTSDPRVLRKTGAFGVKYR